MLIFRYYRGTHGVVVVYDITNGESFANVKRWLHEIEQNCEVVNKVLGENFLLAFTIIAVYLQFHCKKIEKIR